MLGRYSSTARAECLHLDFRSLTRTAMKRDVCDRWNHNGRLTIVLRQGRPMPAFRQPEPRIIWPICPNCAKPMRFARVARAAERIKFDFEGDCGETAAPPVTSPQECRDFAHQCVRWAEQTNNASHRQTMRKMAKQFRQVALDLERSIALIDDDTP